MQVYEEACISISCSKIGLYACTANDSANAFLFCLDSLPVVLSFLGCGKEKRQSKTVVRVNIPLLKLLRSRLS